MVDGSNLEEGIPQFFKILLDESACSLPLPPVFVKKLLMKGKFPQNPTLEITQSGGKWGVKLERDGDGDGGKYCFGKGWLQFVKDTKTQAGDFLVFKLTADSTFQVSIFAPNGCEKNFSPASNPPASTRDYKCCSRSSKNVNADKKSTTVTLIEIDDNSDDNNMVYDDEIRETSTERFGSVEEEFRNHYFEKVLSKSHRYTLRIPWRFARESGVKNRKEIILERKGARRKWRVKVWKSKEGVVLLTAGWLDFKKQNKIVEGDTCSFQYFHGSDNGAYIQVEVVKKVAMKRRRP